MSARDPAGQLLRALRRFADTAGVTVRFDHEATIPWASATFVGAQHRVRVSGAVPGDWSAALPEAELRLHGCFVADCVVEPTSEGSLLTMLVLEA